MLAEKYQPEQTFYRMAYRVIPHYAFESTEKLIQQLSNGPAGAAFFYLVTCAAEETEPDEAAARGLDVRVGSLDHQNDFYAIRYPTPRPVDFSAEIDRLPPAEMMSLMSSVVLAPYFSIFVRSQTDEPAYYVLGQSTTGGTTLRRVSLTFNANLGPGPEPTWDGVLEALRQAIATGRQPIAGVGRPQPGEWTESSAKPKRWWQFWRR